MILTPQGGRRRARRLRRSMGQTLIVFALASTTLFGLMGLTVDAGFGYLSSASAERAAAAGALAGVPYMPNNFDMATVKALAATKANGFTDGDTASGRDIHVRVNRYPAGCSGPACNPHRLSVTVTETLQTTFLRLLGFGSFQVSQTQTAEYLRPLGLGQPGAQLGADDTTFGAVNSQYFYMLGQEGYGVERFNGDAFGPNAMSRFASDAQRPDIHGLNGLQQTDVVGQALSRGGYNYLIYVPPGKQTQPRVFNPIFAPTNNYAPLGNQPLLEGEFLDRINNNTDYTHDPTEYAQMSYTIFSVNNVYDRAGDSELSRMVVKPIDAYNAPASYFDLYANTTVSGMPHTFHNWINVGAPLSDNNLVTFTNYNGSGSGVLDGGPYGSYYRLRVDTLDSNGNDPAPSGGPYATNQKSLKQYAVQTWDPNGSASTDVCSGCQVSAMNDMSFMIELNPPAVTVDTRVPLIQIPPDYAGKSVNILMFDPGDVGAGGVGGPPPVSGQIPTSVTIGNSPGTLVSNGWETLTASVSVQPPGLPPMPAFPCPDAGSPQSTVTFFDGDPTAGGRPIVDDITGTTAQDPCASRGEDRRGITLNTHSLSVGTHQIYAVYSGNSFYASSTGGPVSVNVVPGPADCAFSPRDGRYTRNPVSINGDLNVSARLQTTGAPVTTPSGPVQLIQVDNGNSVVDTTNSGPGGIRFTERASTFGLGTHTFTLSYAGIAGSFNACSVTFDVQIVNPPPPTPRPTPGPGTTPTPTPFIGPPTPNPTPRPLSPTTTGVQASPNPATAGNVVTIMATVTDQSGAGNARGRVDFYLDTVSPGSTLCSGMALNNGNAYCSTTVIPAGNHTLIAVYGGDSGCCQPSQGTTSLVVNTSGCTGSCGTPRPSPTGFATLARRSATTPRQNAGSQGAEIKILEPSGTVATASSITDLGPGEHGGVPCPDVSPCPTASDYQDGTGRAAIWTMNSQGENIFNGKWLRFTIAVPRDYNPGTDPLSWYWSLDYVVPPGAIPHDALTVMAQYDGTPIHLTPQG